MWSRGEGPGGSVRELGAFKVEVNMREPEYLALTSLMPGFGNSVEAVIQFIITDWMNKNLGLDWMIEQALVRRKLEKMISGKSAQGGKE
jgi:uncharacterized protein involved in cysteine biosynthesis